MAKKRRSGGRSKGGKGRSEAIHCANCGALVPRDKAIKVTRPVSVVEASLAKELRKAGTIIPRMFTVKYLCVSCAVHASVVKVRPREERKGPL